MPQKFAIKECVPESYYHVYARGGNRQPIFLEKADYVYFRRLFERYLSDKPAVSRSGVAYPHYQKQLQLLTYCQMRNHFHLLVYQTDADALRKFMSSVMTSYSRFFNWKYKRTGSLFEGRYKARRIDNRAYLEHISRYIHLNPRVWRTYTHSSLPYYLGQKPPQWLEPYKITNLFKGTTDYENFLRDYEGQKAMFDEIKHYLADQ